MNLRDAPIRQKLTLVIMLTSTVVLFLTAAAFMAYQIFAFRQALLANSQTIAQITAAQSSAAVFFEDEKGCREILSKLKAEPTILLAALYSRNGKMLARHPASAPAASFPSAPLTREYVIEHKTLNFFVPVRQENQVVGMLYLKWDLSPAYRRLHWYAEMVAMVLIGSMVIALAISHWLQRRISGPILELAEMARAVSDKRDYSVRAKKYGDDELGLLTDAFNQMLSRIHAQNEALRKNEEQLLRALQSAQTAAGEVRLLNAELEDRVAHRTAELAATNQELETFAYSVSHDLRAPLRHIDGFAQILEDEIPKDPAGARQYISRIRQGVQNMGRLVDDLLKLSRVGRVDLKFETVRLNTIVENVLADMKLELAHRDVEWRIAELPSASVDPGLITQVFANLISNAVKYSRPRQRAVIEIGVAPVDGATAIFVRDNGVGFNMKFAHKLFGVFQRLHLSEDFEGTGVGLATVQRIVRLHGGKIWANAELDKGATFYFTLQGIAAAL
jgi:signal transduction histidine kinase